MHGAGAYISQQNIAPLRHLSSGEQRLPGGAEVGQTGGLIVAAGGPAGVQSPGAAEAGLQPGTAVVAAQHKATQASAALLAVSTAEPDHRDIRSSCWISGYETRVAAR